MTATILYIEDNPMQVDLVKHVLERDGYEVLIAFTGTDGLEIALAEQPDLLLVDLRLPDIPGFDVIERIREHPELAPIPVIVMTAYAMDGDRERFLALGCNAFITKPIARREVLNAIHLALQNARCSAGCD